MSPRVPPPPMVKVSPSSPLSILIEKAVASPVVLPVDFQRGLIVVQTQERHFGDGRDLAFGGEQLVGAHGAERRRQFAVSAHFDGHRGQLDAVGEHIARRAGGEIGLEPHAFELVIDLEQVRVRPVGFAAGDWGAEDAAQPVAEGHEIDGHNDVAGNVRVADEGFFGVSGAADRLGGVEGSGQARREGVEGHVVALPGGGELPVLRLEAEYQLGFVSFGHSCHDIISRGRV